MATKRRAPRYVNPVLTPSGLFDPTWFRFLTTEDYWESNEMDPEPEAPDVGYGRLYFRDNGAGKTQLVVRFNTGAVQVIATEP